MKQLAAFLLLCALAFADGPTIVGSPDLNASDNSIRVKVGQPPWVNLSIKDAPAEAVQTWTGPIGEGQIGFFTRDGVGGTTAVQGTYKFRCILQTPKDGLDDVDVLEVMLIVGDGGPNPPPPPPPVEDFAAKVTAAVKAKPEASASLAKVVSVYSLVADQIKLGLLKEPSQVTSMTSLLTAAASPAWADIDTTLVQPHLKSLTLATAADYEPLWRQIAAAVKAGLTDIPPPDPPIPTTEFRVLILEETADRGQIPSSQLSVITSAPLRKWLDEMGAKWRVWDKDVDASREDAAWQAALKLEHGPLPWIHIANGTTGFSGPLPKTLDETKTLIGKYKP